MHEVSFLSDLPHDVQTDLSDRLISKTHSKDEFIFHQGDEGASLYLIKTGEIKISSLSIDGRESILAILWPGDTFGELALFDSKPRSTDAVCRSGCEILSLSNENFWQSLDSHPAAYRGVLKMMSLRLRQADQLIEDSAFLDVPARLARVILRISQSEDHSLGGNGVVKVSQAELAGMVGATREMVNKSLRKLEAVGHIERHGKEILVKSSDGLRSLLHG